MKYRALSAELKRRSNQGETNLVIRDGKIISRIIIQKSFLWRVPVKLSSSRIRKPIRNFLPSTPMPALSSQN